MAKHIKYYCFSAALSIFISVAAWGNYDTHTGRFLTRDPIGYGDGMNLYQYVQSSPVMSMDVIGHRTETKVRSNNDPRYGKKEPGGVKKPFDTKQCMVMTVHCSAGMPKHPCCKNDANRNSSTDPDFVGPPAPSPGRGGSCGIQAKRSAICNPLPQKASDFGHEWITDGSAIYDHPKNYFNDEKGLDVCHKFDEAHPMHIWNTSITNDNGSTLPDGTSCGQASCDEIKQCLQDAENVWKKNQSYNFLGSNCIDFSNMALSVCCLEKSDKVRSPSMGEELRTCHEREEEMKRLGCCGKGGP